MPKLTVEGEEIEVESFDVVERIRELLAEKKGGNVITAPISGRIIKVLVKPGDSVEKDSVLFMIESMKTILEVKAPMKLRVTEVCVKENNFVRSGDIVIKYEKC